MPTPQKPIEDAIVALTTNTPELYGEPFFHWAAVSWSTCGRPTILPRS